MKSLPYFFGSNVLDSRTETVEKALDSIVENASKYRELMGGCDPHGLAFGRQLIERKQNSNRSQIMFSIAQPETSNKKSLVLESPSASRQEARFRINELIFPTITHHEEQRQTLSFKKPHPPKTLLEDFMHESKHRVNQKNNRGMQSSLLQHDIGTPMKQHEKARLASLDSSEDYKQAEKRKFQEEVTAEFFATHKRLLVPESSNYNQSPAPKKFENEQTKSKTKLLDDIIGSVQEEFSLPAFVFSKQNLRSAAETSLNESQENVCFTEKSRNELDVSQGEAPVRNSIFWLHRSFPHLD